MAPDLKIEIFAYKLFHKLWYDLQVIEVVPDILEIYGDECAIDDSYMEACDDLIMKAAYSRSDFVSKIYMSSISSEEIINFKTLSEVYDYIIRMCDRDDLFGHLTVFDRMLATSDFVGNICYSIHIETYGFLDVLSYCHIFWTMYFDKFTEEFYEKGGWCKLKQEAICYELLHDFYRISYGYSNFYLQAIKEATVNYCHFKNAINYQEQKHQHPVHISKLWIQFRIEHFESYINIPFSYDTYVNTYEADLLLEDLKLILDPTRCNPDNLEISKAKHQSSTFSTEMSYSKIHSALEDKKANLDDETQIRHVSFEHENRIIDKVPDEFSRICKDFKEESQSSCLTSAAEELTLDIDSNGNQELYENTFTEMEQLRQTSSVDAARISNTERNHFPALEMKRRPETSVENPPNVSDFDSNHSCSSKSYIDKREDSTIGNLYAKNLANSGDLGSTNEIVSYSNEMENYKEMIEMNLCSKNGWIEIVKSMDDSSSSEIAAHERNGKRTPEDLLTLKDFSVNENANIDGEMRRIKKARKKLRKEQRDPKVKNFLRMLLVLGDMEGAKFVLSTLENIEEGSGHM